MPPEVEKRQQEANSQWCPINMCSQIFLKTCIDSVHMNQFSQQNNFGTGNVPD